MHPGRPPEGRLKRPYCDRCLRRLAELWAGPLHLCKRCHRELNELADQLKDRES